VSLRGAYSLWAPLYDRVGGPLTRPLRRQAIAAARVQPGERILLVGVGTGLDLDWLPREAEVVGLDLTPAMLTRAEGRALRLDQGVGLLEGDARALPFPDEAFDRVFLHFLLAVAPAPATVLAESARVTRVAGRLHILDKFLRPGQRAPFRRALAPALGRIATRTDLVFEEVLARVPGLQVESDVPVRLRGWFRRIVLRRFA